MRTSLAKYKRVSTSEDAMIYYMRVYERERWFEIYRSAMVETQPSLMAGRMRDARAEIGRRVEQLKGVPRLYAEEGQAIEDALTGLKVLEREQALHAAELPRQNAQDGR
jgi:hypothetical protein